MLAAWQNLSLRFRLTLLYVGLLSVLLFALGSFLYFDTRDFLISTTTLRLQAQAAPVTARAFRPGHPDRILSRRVPAGFHRKGPLAVLRA